MSDYHLGWAINMRPSCGFARQKHRRETRAHAARPSLASAAQPVSTRRFLQPAHRGTVRWLDGPSVSTAFAGPLHANLSDRHWLLSPNESAGRTRVKADRHRFARRPTMTNGYSAAGYPSLSIEAHSAACSSASDMLEMFRWSWCFTVSVGLPIVRSVMRSVSNANDRCAQGRPCYVALIVARANVAPRRECGSARPTAIRPGRPQSCSGCSRFRPTETAPPQPARSREEARASPGPRASKPIAAPPGTVGHEGPGRPRPSPHWRRRKIEPDR